MGVDIDVSLGAEIKAGLGQMNAKLDREHRASDNYRKSKTPWSLPWRNSAVAPSNSATVPFGINLGQASTGYQYEVRRIIVGGQTWSTAAAGTSEVYVSALDGMVIPTIRNLADLVDQSATLPSKAYYSTGQVTMRSNEQLVVVIVGGTASQLYVANALLQVMPARPAGEEFQL